MRIKEMIDSAFSFMIFVSFIRNCWHEKIKEYSEKEKNRENMS